ncbi:hypothetical protein K402DRAFT_418803 [Aulographum hederae CBS 113979]|uniref:Uncharacterized protein n=1 Tax=Aulographum hederae CBS 113979 TaxID=1176131 RepID=A0A6G1H6V4_9PEZI|nr:hypothetical protein K402DRAFT_418803 [Aulographum hederae CBS 113979]
MGASPPEEAPNTTSAPHPADRRLLPQRTTSITSPIQPPPRAAVSRSDAEQLSLTKSQEWVQSQSTLIGQQISPSSDDGRTSYIGGAAITRNPSTNVDSVLDEKSLPSTLVATRSNAHDIDPEKRGSTGAYSNNSRRSDYSRNSKRSHLSQQSRQSHRDPFRSPVLSPTSYQSYPTQQVEEQEEEEDVDLQKKTLQILIFLALPCAVLSLLTLFWTLIALLTVLLLQPFRLFANVKPDLVSFLSPPLRLQLSMIYAPIPPSQPETPAFTSSGLLLAHLLGPFMGVGVAIASWVSGGFWVFSAILGDPAGKDKYNDGRSTVLAVRAWWERWLLKAVAKELR